MDYEQLCSGRAVCCSAVGDNATGVGTIRVQDARESPNQPNVPIVVKGIFVTS